MSPNISFSDNYENSSINTVFQAILFTVKHKLQKTPIYRTIYKKNTFVCYLLQQGTDLISTCFLLYSSVALYQEFASVVFFL